MHSPISYVQLQENPGQFTSVRDVTFSESGTSGQAFSRGVEEVDSILCPMRTNETTENHLQQPTVPFHNPFHDSRFKKRSVVIVVSHAIKDHPLIPVRTEAQNDKPAPAYIPENERFSIQSILGLGQSSLQGSSVVDNNRAQKSDESCLLPIQRQSNRYQNDPDFAQHVRERARANRKKLRKDPAYVQRERERERERKKELRKNPAYAQRERKRQRERYQNDPVYAQKIRDRERERQRERQRELRNDPAFVKREIERQRKLRKNPAYVERMRQKQRERYKNDPDFAERRREYQRKKYRNNPDYVAQQKEYQRKRRSKNCRKQATFAEEKTIQSAN